MTIDRIKLILDQQERIVLHDSSFVNFTRAAVMILLFPTKGGISTLFTVRTDSVDTHKGQISFPGGMVDPHDQDICATALRETWEELGIPMDAISVLGLLDDLAVPSQFIITPVVGCTDSLPRIFPNPSEVAEVFDVPLDELRNPTDAWSERRLFRGEWLELWHYRHAEHIIWGATAAIVRNLLHVLYPNEMSR